MNHNNTVFGHDVDNNNFPVSSGLLFVGLIVLLLMPGWLLIGGIALLMLPSLRL